MRAYKIWTIKNDPNTKAPVYFYFKKKIDADLFIDTFKDHWVHVEFSGGWDDIPVGLENDIAAEMKIDPEVRAEKELDWGVGFAKFYGDDKLTEEEGAFLHKLGKAFNKK